MQREIIAEISKHLGITPADIDLEAQLSEDLGLGPIEMADLLSALSEKFNVTFNPAEIAGLKTVNDLVAVVEDLSLE